jgi:tetrahydromethanopterin S-methyltransferase subunit A
MKEKPPIKKIIAKKDAQEWHMDAKGYFLIDPQPQKGVIYAHHYHPDKTYHCSIQGKDAESIYYTILRKELVGTLMHAAYLGSELQKAEQTLHQQQLVYVQDKPLQKQQEK